MSRPQEQPEYVLKYPSPTDEELKKVVEYVVDAGRRREKAQGKLDDGDYIAGAMSVWFALGWAERIPAWWIFSWFSGESPLDDVREKKLRERINALESTVLNCDFSHDDDEANEELSGLIQWVKQTRGQV